VFSVNQGFCACGDKTAKNRKTAKAFLTSP
jgi:hypothetical protein